MSVGIWRGIDGDCHCRDVFTPGDVPRTCRHFIMSDFGVVEHPRAEPHRGHIGHLVLVSASGFHDLIKDGPNYRDWPGLASATLTTPDDPPTEDSIVRMFYHLEWAGEKWTWELFEAHWTDLSNRSAQLYIGRWPD